jgi:nitrate reductase NapE component
MEENIQQPQESPEPEISSQSNSIRPQPAEITNPKKKSSITLILLVITLIAICAVGYFGYTTYMLRGQIIVTPPPPNLPIKPIDIPNVTSTISGATKPQINSSVSNNFCSDRNYCNMNEICSALPPNHGVCTSDIDCTKYNLCGNKETLMISGMEVMFEESMATENEKTRVGYMLVRNTNNLKQNVNIENVECLNFEGLCKYIKATYPMNFQINADDVVIFPVYIENQEGLKGLVSFEFTFKIGEKSPMIGVDLIFNNNKTCIYQWGGLETSRKVYFQEKDKIDWTQHCQ